MINALAVPSVGMCPTTFFPLKSFLLFFVSIFKIYIQWYPNGYPLAPGNEKKKYCYVCFSLNVGDNKSLRFPCPVLFPFPPPQRQLLPRIYCVSIQSMHLQHSTYKALLFCVIFFKTYTNIDHMYVLTNLLLSLHVTLLRSAQRWYIHIQTIYFLDVVM